MSEQEHVVTIRVRMKPDGHEEIRGLCSCGWTPSPEIDDLIDAGCELRPHLLVAAGIGCPRCQATGEIKLGASKRRATTFAAFASCPDCEGSGAIPR